MLVALDEDFDALKPASGEGPSHRVAGRSDRIPFPNGTFDLIVCHHSLEHLTALSESLAEMKRLLKPTGKLYIAVPNGYGLCDAVYRFTFQGGGHVNRFARQQLVALIESVIGLRLVWWQKLYSSFIYLHRLRELHGAPDLPRRLRLLRRFPRIVSAVQRSLYRGTRLLDRILHTDLAVYGWAFYLIHDGGSPAEGPAYVNVCLYCGSGNDAKSVERPSRSTYRCEACNRINPFVKPFRNTC